MPYQGQLSGALVGDAVLAQNFEVQVHVGVQYGLGLRVVGYAAHVLPHFWALPAHMGQIRRCPF